MPKHRPINPRIPTRSAGARLTPGSRPSSVIRDFSYDAEQEQLEITFTTGKIYIYDKVPADIFADFESAPSLGIYFNKHIRDYFACREVTWAS